MSVATAMRGGFRAACGTAPTFGYPDGENMDLPTGSFADPRRFVSRHRFSIATMLPRWRAPADLTGILPDGNATTVVRWTAATGKLPE
ncbi:MAG: glutathione-dependent formaldehyde-activating protein [Sphingomonas bacterium]|nr:hypothetical protein [Sphingomonas bacterium]MDB5689584.1 glutathione-dependent formaldehyde-activating protein [Sphingomonas bacterium]